MSDFLDTIDRKIQDKIFEADQKASSSGPEYYVTDQKGYSRGLYHAKNEILNALRNEFFPNKLE